MAMGLKDKMMDRMVENMSKEEKAEMMDKMMERFFADFTPEEKQQLMLKMMPKMMQGVDLSQMMPQMMMAMMGGMMGGRMDGASPASSGSTRDAMMTGYYADEVHDAGTGAAGGETMTRKAEIARPGTGAPGAPMPFDMCRRMEAALLSIAEVNKALLEELKRK